MESNEDKSTLVRDLFGKVVIPDESVRPLAADLWGFLALNLVGTARLWINNSIPLEGFDLWQRVRRHVPSRSGIRRHELLTQVQRLATAGKLSEVPMALIRWDRVLREYIEAGGASEGEQSRAYLSVRGQVQRQVNLTIQWSGMGSLPGGSQPTNLLPGDHEDPFQGLDQQNLGV